MERDFTAAWHEEVILLEVDGGKTLHCVYDHGGISDPSDGERPLIVIVPQYEGTVRSGLLLSMYLLLNGFDTLRFDFSNHLGNSGGEFTQFTMSGALADLRAVLEGLVSTGRLGSRRTAGIVCGSLSSRIVFRALAESPSGIDVAISLFGVVDPSATIRAINGELDIEKLLADPDYRFGIVKVLHYAIDVDRFARDLVSHRMHSLEETREDVRRIRTPLYLLVAEKDRWVRIEDYHSVFSTNPAILRATLKIPNAGHEIFKNVRAAKSALKPLTRCFLDFYRRSRELIEPTIEDFIELNARERLREQDWGERQRVGTEETAHLGG